jgi:hypothetical protein
VEKLAVMPSHVHPFTLAIRKDLVSWPDFCILAAQEKKKSRSLISPTDLSDLSVLDILKNDRTFRGRKTPN